MEVPLVLNKSTNLDYYDDSVGVSLYDESLVGLDARYARFYQVEVTNVLIEGFRLCGAPTKLARGTNIELPTIWIGFQLDSEQVLNRWYLAIVEGSKFFANLFDNRPPKLVNLRVDIKTLKQDRNGCRLEPVFTSHLFTIQNGGDIQHAQKVEFNSNSSDSCIRDSWSAPENNWKTIISLTLIFPKVSNITRSLNEPRIFLGKMLRDEIFCDATILFEDGTEIKCHRSILAAASSVFASTFQTDLTESQSGSLKLPEMSVSSGHALLTYIYEGATSPAYANCMICLDLYKAGRKYEIVTLERAMKKLLLKNDATWYTAETALQLYLLACERNHQDLKQKAMKVLKLKFRELEKLPSYQQLFRDNLGAAKELIKFFATAKCCTGNCTCLQLAL